MSYWKRFVEWCQEPSKIKIRSFNPRNVMVLATLSILIASSITFGWHSYFLAQSTTPFAYSKERVLVQLTGDIITRESAKPHYVNRHEWGVVVHRDLPSYVACKHVETKPGLWSVDDTFDFAGEQDSKFGFHIYKEATTGRFGEYVQAGSAWACFRFGGYTLEDLDEGIIWHERLVGLRKYQLEGYGQWDGESMPYGIITVDNEPFKISLMIWTEVTEGQYKGGSYIEYEEVWSGRLSFTATIAPFSPPSG